MKMKNTFEKMYPFLHLYVGFHGFMEIGAGDYSTSWVRLLDEGGTRLECDEETLDKSLTKAEIWAKEWMNDNYSKEEEEEEGIK
jgi:hypothetical protein